MICFSSCFSSGELRLAIEQTPEANKCRAGSPLKTYTEEDRMMADLINEVTQKTGLRQDNAEALCRNSK